VAVLSRRFVPPAEPAPPTPTLALVRKDAEQFERLIATLEKLGKAMLASAMVGPHKTGPGIKSDVAKFWEVL
jgi:hypothetical protein